jgi:outer membrane protein assembly factor BamB
MLQLFKQNAVRNEYYLGGENTMRKFFILPILYCFLALVLSACGKSDGASAIIGGGPAGAPGGGSGGSGSLVWSAGIKGTPSGTAGPTIIPFFISSAALVADGTVYIGSTDHFLYAFRADGSLKWTYETGNSLFASPAVGSDGTIYFGSEDRQIYAINPAGILKWAIPTKSVFTSSAAIGADGTIYVAGTGGDLTILPLCPDVIVQLSNFYALTPTGDIKWIISLSGIVNSSPAIASDGTIYIGTQGDLKFDRTNPCDQESIFPPSNANPGLPSGGHLYAINPNGTIKWDFHTLGVVDSSPAIGANGTIYVGSHRSLKFYGENQSVLLDQDSITTGFITAINPNGTLKWFTDLFGDVDSSPAVGSDGTIYVGSDSFHVYALNAIDGRIKWLYPTRDKVKSSPAIAANGTIYIGSNDGSLYALNPDGTLDSRFDTTGAVNSAPLVGSDGKVYFVSSSGKGDSADSSTLYTIFGNSGALADTPWPKFRRDLPDTGRQ